MPELPEVETMRRGLLPIVGATIETAERPPCRLRPISWTPCFDDFRLCVSGRRIVEVGRRGKRVLLQLDDDSVIVVEPRMTGLLLLADPPGEEHLRLRLRLRSATAGGPAELLFWDRRGLGTIRWLAAEQIEAVLGEHRLGPDALQIDAETLRDRLGSSRRAIKVALLDQRAAAGIGNLYAAEILYRAGVDPRTRCDLLSRPQWQRIAAATQFILNEAITYEGSTLSDGTYRNALNDPGGYQNHHLVYDREGRRCGRCDEGRIRRIVQAQRSTFFCPGCQRRSGCHPAVR